MKKYIPTVYFLVIALVCSPLQASTENVVKTKTITLIKNVPVIKQLPELPTGCEVTSLAMLLQYNGFNFSKLDVANTIVKAPLPSLKNGIMQGAHPKDYFVGTPFSKQSYGVYAPVIVSTLEKLAPGRSLDLSGKSFEDILKSLDQGQPVIMWVTIGLKEIQKTAVWNTPYGKYQWIAPEHAVVLAGYNNESVFVNDPLTGSLVAYSKTVFINRWNSLGNQAVSMKPSIYRKDVVFKGKPLELIDSQKALIYNGEAWLPVRTFTSLINNAEIYKEKNIYYLKLNGKLIPLQTNNQIGLQVKLVDGVNFIHMDYINRYLRTKHTITSSQLRIF